MQEHPEQFSDEQFEAMMEELDREPNVEAAWQRFEHSTHPSHRWLHIAAMLAGIIFLTGLAWATIHWIHTRNHDDVAIITDTIVSSTNSETEAMPVNFSNVRLDSILTVVAAHYEKSVVFRDEAPRSKQFIMTWHPDSPLTEFIDALNTFDELQLTMQNDTLFVASKKEVQP